MPRRERMRLVTRRTGDTAVETTFTVAQPLPGRTFTLQERLAADRRQRDDEPRGRSGTSRRFAQHRNDRRPSHA